MTPSPHAFAAVDLSKRYGTRWALRRLTYTLPQGRALLLTGHNGSGKTTFLRLLATATSPSMGSLRIFDHALPANRESVRPGVALLSHANHLYEDLSALDNLLILSRLLGTPDAKNQCTALLARVGLAKRLTDSPVRQFSAGMRKRVAVARLLLKSPKLVLLDEPFGELDPEGIKFMEGLICELKAAGATLVLATHLIEQGVALSDDRLHLSDGAVVATPS